MRVSIKHQSQEPRSTVSVPGEPSFAVFGCVRSGCRFTEGHDAVQLGSFSSAMAPMVLAAAKAKAQARAKAKAKPQVAARRVPLQDVAPPDGQDVVMPAGHDVAEPVGQDGALPVRPLVEWVLFSSDPHHMHCIIKSANGKTEMKVRTSALRHLLDCPTLMMANPACRLQEVNVPGSILGLGVGNGAPDLPKDCRWQLYGTCDIDLPGMDFHRATVVTNTGVQHAQMLIS